jgi:type I restriction enzyme, S subunit
MKAKAYSRYKQSGVEWLGEVPEHWESVSLKWISARYSGGTPDKSMDEYWEEGTIPWLNSGAVNDGYITMPSALITEEAYINSSAKWIPKDALVMALAGQGKTKGMVAYLGFKTTCNQSMAAIIPNKKINPRFLYWWLTKNYGSLRNLAGGDARDGLNLDMIGGIPCPLLPLPEQQSIASYLDRETGRIDTLIGKKLRIVELLKEKRTAVIARVVTTGLDPAVKMKPSGVDWVGEVPEHWDVKKIIFLLDRLQDGTHFSPDSDFSGDYLYITAKNIKEWGIDLSEITYVSKDAHDEIYKRCPVRKGDVLYIKDGATAGIATVNTFADPFSMLSSVAMLRPKLNQYDSRFMAYHLNMSSFKNYVLNSLVGGAMTRFTIEIIRKFKLVTPPLPEQQSIVSYLDRETAKLDALISKVDSAILKLKEYRTALISAAVTGKIDVRNGSSENYLVASKNHKKKSKDHQSKLM